MLVPVEMMRELVVMFAGNVLLSEFTNLMLPSVGPLNSGAVVQGKLVAGYKMVGCKHVIFQNCHIVNMAIEDCSDISIVGNVIHGDVVQNP